MGRRQSTIAANTTNRVRSLISNLVLTNYELHVYIDGLLPALSFPIEANVQWKWKEVYYIREREANMEGWARASETG